MKRIGLMISVSLLVLTASLPSFQIAHAVEAKQKGSDTVSGIQSIKTCYLDAHIGMVLGLKGKVTNDY
ncbi:hypothetical protein MH117_02930 [Paenibacillus sp. ACRRX]|uniref:hypothetical protein n=1 Tax=Paenibacillus sp. ACRRX TaxID=2918206 RepID=UPI001EF3F0A6|nr:hypothetical protein [Paenibacillus sp. ACRRX]MCG7406356.1 hypothetical protein [Paenibacillus sp. ACRRX]